MKHPQDHFSPIAAQYVRGRIGYPDDLYRFLSDQCPQRDLAWDCATGTGQAALDLTRKFHQVIATDISNELLALATPHPRVNYRIAPAEDSGLATDSVDLITVAQALHWFDLPPFWAEITRVLKPRGIFAFWGYNWPVVNPGVDQVLAKFKAVIAESWPERSAIIHREYVSIHSPFPEISTPSFEATAQWDMNAWLDHLNSWSATRYYREHTGIDAVDQYREAFRRAWISEANAVRWPLVLKVSRKT